MTDAVPPLRRRRRAVTALALSAAAALALSGCENRLGAAALVGDHRITDDRVQALVDESLAAPGVRAALPASDYKGDLGAYRRAVLNVEVERLLAEAAARRLGLPIDEGKVDARYRFFEQQAGGPERFASELATRLAISPTLYRQLVRTEVIESEIGFERGGVQRPTEAQLRLLYEQALPSELSTTLSLIQLTDEATARQVLARVQADPASFAEVAEQSGADDAAAAAQPRSVKLADLPADLVARVQRVTRTETFTYRLSNGVAEAFFVIRASPVMRPTLDMLRPRLEAETLRAAATAGQKILAQTAGELGVDVNPRFGSWNPQSLAITDYKNPVIKPTPDAPSPTEGLPGTGGEPGASPTPADGSPSATPGG